MAEQYRFFPTGFPPLSHSRRRSNQCLPGLCGNFREVGACQICRSEYEETVFRLAEPPPVACQVAVMCLETSFRTCQSMSDQETKSERRLAAILVTDIAGYSSLMQSDEAGTF